jgi:hypothetical protein
MVIAVPGPPDRLRKSASRRGVAHQEFDDQHDFGPHGRGRQGHLDRITRDRCAVGECSGDDDVVRIAAPRRAD